MGLYATGDSCPKTERPLVISNMGQLENCHGYLDNQTRVSSSEGYYFKEKIGLFKFISGDTIEVFTDYDQLDADFVRTLLNYPIACIFYQNKIFSLHASAVEYCGKVIIFPGSSLTGKSTMAAYFLKNGGKLVTEDTAVIEIRQVRHIKSSYPFLKLSESANNELSFSTSSGIRLPREKCADGTSLSTKVPLFQIPFQSTIVFFLIMVSENLLIQLSHQRQ